MYIPERDEVLKRPELPRDADPRYVKPQGDWESNHFTDEFGVEWYTVTYRAEPHKKRVWVNKRSRQPV